MKKPVFLISGAAGGLGGALALAAAQLRAELLLLDRDSAGLDRVSDAISAQGWSPPGLCPLDLAVAGPDAYEQLVGIAREEFGGLNHLIHCAAHFSSLTPLDQVAPEEWMKAIQVNVNAAWALTVACLPSLREAETASITFVGDDPSRSQSAFWGPYGVSKAAVRSLADILSEELESTSVKVRLFEPGPMRTAMRAKAYLAEDPVTQPEAAEAAATLLEMITGEPGPRADS